MIHSSSFVTIILGQEKGNLDGIEEVIVQNSIWPTNCKKWSNKAFDYVSTDHHSVDDDDLHDAGGAEHPVINVPEAAVHQSSDHPA